MNVIPIENMSNAELDALAIRQDRNRATQGYKFQTVAEMSAMPAAKDHLIKGIFARGESSAWIAPPGGMKSALLGQASVNIGYGHDWHGYRSKGPAGVVYFALERADLVRRRILAHVAKLGLNPPPIVVVGDMVDPRNAKRIVETIHEAEIALGISIGLTVFDTFAKLIAAAGGDENQAKDQGMVFANLQRVKNLTNVHVAIIGHTGKEVSRGMRGSNAALGDVDLMVEISGDDIRTATVTKANDAPEGPLFSFKSEVHTFGTDEDGDPITVNIVSSEEVSSQLETKGREPKLTANQKTVFAMLHAAGAAGLTLEEWNNQAKDAGIGIKRKADLTDIRNSLLSKKLVRTYNDRWNVCHD
jgi:hypothetical protein